MLRRTVPGTMLLLALACRGAARGDTRLAAGATGAAAPAAPPAPAPPDSVPCVPGDRMPRVAVDTTREYTLRVFRPDSTRRYATRVLPLPPCPRPR